MKYDLEADWHLLDTCNYRCGYCFLSPDTLAAKLRTFASPEDWRRAFDATGHTWLIHMTGGEPSLYPGFVDLCEGLTERHFISVNSNLAHPSIERFAQCIKPARVSFLNAGLHLEERDRRMGYSVFLRNLDALLSNNFTTLVSLVATPAALRRFQEAVVLLSPVGLFPIPKLLRGDFAGKRYPEAYSQSEREIFKTASRKAREFYAGQLAGREEAPSIDMLNDDRYVEGLQIYTGRLCRAGERFVQIAPNGEIFRCGGKEPMGNLLEGTLRRRSGATPCASSHCYYFCDKYAAVPPAPASQDRARRGVLRMHESVLAALGNVGLPLRRSVEK
jgi:MoaA/NifB/PqqE/SkfB family radical SAM enzyme